MVILLHQILPSRLTSAYDRWVSTNTRQTQRYPCSLFYDWFVEEERDVLLAAASTSFSTSMQTMKGINTSTELLSRLKAAGVATIKDAMGIAEVTDNPLSIRILNALKETSSNDIEPVVKSLCKFLTTKKVCEKLSFIFRIYDLDQDGFVTNIELFDMLLFLNRGALPGWKLQNVVDKTFGATSDYVHRVSFEDFLELMKRDEKRLMRTLQCTEW